MPLANKGKLVLEKAEVELRRLAGEAVEAGSYEDVQQLAEWAKLLAELHGGSPAKAPSGGATPAAPKTTRPRRKKATGKYPHFAREGEVLVKTGWSKKKKTEYEHRAPRSVIASLVAAMKKAGAGRRPVVMERVLPLVDPDKGEIPNYQVYVGLSVLKHIGTVEPHGRQGYTLVLDGRTPEAAANELWDSLPERSA